jgi:RimJ/RimL family protein N-acetyltransferase
MAVGLPNDVRVLMFDLHPYKAREFLKDGTPVTIRSIHPDDSGGILDAFNRLDRDSIYRRFFRLKKELTATELQQLTQDDTGRVVALVVTTQTEEGELLMGGGRFVLEPTDASQTASLAFLTDVRFHGRGVASVVLAHLVRIARKFRLMRFEADVLVENQPMLRVFRSSGLRMEQRRRGNVVQVTLSL